MRLTIFGSVEPDIEFLHVIVYKRDFVVTHESITRIEKEKINKKQAIKRLGQVSFPTRVTPSRTGHTNVSFLYRKRNKKYKVNDRMKKGECEKAWRQGEEGQSKRFERWKMVYAQFHDVGLYSSSRTAHCESLYVCLP
jgi:hypothetical protein